MAFKLSLSELPSLIETLRKWSPESLQMYSLLRNSYRTNNVWPVLEVYVDSKDMEKLTSVVAVWYLTSQRTQKRYTFYTRDQNTSKVLIREPGVVEIERDEFISLNCVEPTIDVVAEYLKVMNFIPGIIGPAYTYILDDLELADEIASREIPAKLRIAPLEVKHAKFLLNAWQYGTAPAIEFFENEIKYQQTLALFNEKGEPISWVVAKAWGDIGSTYTSPGYRRQGLASILTAKLAKLILQQNDIPFTKINKNNETSVALHTKVGFKEVKVNTIWFKLN
ncbi:glycine-N-acyltransferase-like protein 3 [Ptychodera flava]|uniref:glycine-N-acyltransferase-like protein 3 n=1 Tax=Ptychodera flava TaxID=63121 RepID=UPI003969BB72